MGGIFKTGPAVVASKRQTLAILALVAFADACGAAAYVARTGAPGSRERKSVVEQRMGRAVTLEPGSKMAGMPFLAESLSRL